MDKIARAAALKLRASLALLPLLVAGPLSAPPAFAQPMPPDRALKQAAEGAEQIEAATGSTANGKAPAGDPCALLPAAEVGKAFASVAAPERRRRLEKYGIAECQWKGSNGQLLLDVQESIAESATQAREQALEMAQGLFDPLKSGAASSKSVRIETFAIPGIDNAAFVETADPARGIGSDVSFLALVKGRQTVTLMSSELSRRPRAEALKALESLGAAAAKSMIK